MKSAVASLVSTLALSAAVSGDDGKETTMMDPRAVSVAYIEAVGQKQFDRVAELLHPEVEFRMPGREIRGAPAYIAVLRRLAPVMLRNEVQKTIVEAGQVGVFYDFVTDTAVGAVPSVEWLTVEDGRIRSVWLVFHSQPWPAVLEELGRRQAPGAGGEIAQPAVPKTGLTGRVHLFARPEVKERLKWCFTTVLGTTAAASLDAPGLSEPVLAFRFPNGGSLSVEFTEDALDESQARHGAWVEIQADDPAAIKKRVLEAGLPQVKYLGNDSFYFAAPGGQVLRIVSAREP